jgi:hypothetical protein
LITLLFITFLASCSFEDDLKVEPKPESSDASKKNPFTTENIAQALSNISSKKNGRVNVVAPSTTHNYVRFAPQNLNQVMLLEDVGYDLWDEPLDQHIEYADDYYQAPGLPDSLNYFYTLIPANYSIISSVPYTILSQVVLFDEDAGDEADPEEVEDPWIPEPDPGNGVCYDEYGSAYLCGTEPKAYLRKAVNDLPEDLVKKTTIALIKAGVNLNELYNEAMRLAGYEEEIMVDPKNSNGRTQAIRYAPGGRITVWDNSINVTVPVKGAEIKTRRFIKIDHTYTDANGFFRVSKGYRAKAQVLVKFKNDWAKIRGVTAGLKVWQWAKPVKKKLGLFEKSAMENISFRFDPNSNAESKQALQFAAAHALNTIAELNQFCLNNGINTIPNNLNLWITTSSWFRTSAAPMLNKVTDPIQALQLISAIIVPPVTPGSLAKKAVAILMHYAPDVAIKINPDGGTTIAAGAISDVAFHELSHAVHYNKVGRSYWVLNVIKAYIYNFVTTNSNYANKTSNYAGLVAVIESWAYFAGNTFNETKYRALGTADAISIANQNRDFLEGQVPGDTDWWRWIPYGALHDMRDVVEPTWTGVIDNVSGYSLPGIYAGFQPSITTVQGLRQQILNSNANSQATQVNQLITSYRW